MGVIMGTARLGAGRTLGSLILRLLNINHPWSCLLDSGKMLSLSELTALQQLFKCLMPRMARILCFSPCSPAHVSLVWLIFNQANIQ